MRRWMALVVVLALIGIAFAAGLAVDGGDWHRNGVSQVVTSSGQEVVVIQNRGGFFPFGLFFIPLFFVGIFALMRLFFWRGRPMGYGACPPGSSTRDGWLQEWHRNAHTAEPSAPVVPPSEPPPGQ